MSGKVILLSGPIGSGKSTLANSLTSEYGGVLFKTNELIAQLRPAAATDRETMQEAGDALDRATSGQWVQEALVSRLDNLASSSMVVVDAVRIRSQIDGIRQAFGNRVYHVHLTASDRELSRRYKKRAPKIQELSSFEEARKNQTERDIERLAEAADILVSTERCTERDVLVRAVARLGLYPRGVNRLVDVLVGGQWGSEGKGNIVAHLAPEYQYLMRVGGPNAGHKVYGNPVQTFHHLPSGTVRSNAHLLIGPGAVIRVPTLLDEIAEWGVDHDRLSIDPTAMIISDADVERERARLASIGSTAQGVGEATARKINDRGQLDSRGKCLVNLARDISRHSPDSRGCWTRIAPLGVLGNGKSRLAPARGGRSERLTVPKR